MTPDELLRRYPRETLPWLRHRLPLSRRAFAAWLGVPVTTVAGWEQGTRPIPPVFLLRLVPLVTRYLATKEGQALLQTLGRGEGGAMADEPREVTTFCPRRGSPIVWSVTPVEGGEPLEVTGSSCFCPLTDEEWAELADEATRALDQEGAK